MDSKHCLPLKITTIFSANPIFPHASIKIQNNASLLVNYKSLSYFDAFSIRNLYIRVVFTFLLEYFILIDSIWNQMATFFFCMYSFHADVGILDIFLVFLLLLSLAIFSGKLNPDCTAYLTTFCSPVVSYGSYASKGEKSPFLSLGNVSYLYWVFSSVFLGFYAMITVWSFKLGF